MNPGLGQFCISMSTLIGISITVMETVNAYGANLDGVISCNKKFVHVKAGYCLTWDNLTNSEELYRHSQDMLLTFF